MQIGLGFPELSLPTLQSALTPQGFGSHKDELTPPAPDLTPPPELLRHSPPDLGSPAVPGGQEHSALWSTPRHWAVGLQQGEPPQNVGPHGSEHGNQNYHYQI